MSVSKNIALVVITISGLALATGSVAVAEVINVPDDFANIQAAIDHAVDGDEVVLAQGVYVQHIDFVGKAITVRGTDVDDPAVVEATVIDGSGAPGSVVTFSQGEGPGSILEGVSITNGEAAIGAGIYCLRSSPTIRHCVITGNNADDSGGGISASFSSPLIDSCVINGNLAEYLGGGLYLIGGSPRVVDSVISANQSGVEGNGAGIFCALGQPTITGCAVVYNVATDWGCGGITCNLTQSALIADCLIAGNQGDRGGISMWRNGGTITIRNCTITGNDGTESSGGVWMSNDGFLVDPTILTMANNIVFDNTSPGEAQIVALGPDLELTVTFSNVPGGESGVGLSSDAVLLWGEGNLDADPLFVDAGAGDFHLTEDSPCIDAGDPLFEPDADETDIDGEARVQQCRVDMGSDESPYFVDCNDNANSDACDLLEGTSHDDNGNGVPDECETFGVHNLTKGISYLEIQPAIDAASSGDVIEVDPGTYLENVDFLDLDITVRSTDPLDLDVVESTIIDGGGLDTVVTLSAGTLSGFTITGGANSGIDAGGVHATGTAVVNQNVITGNAADEDGGGVIARDTAMVHNNHIVSNSAVELGGGVSARDNSVIIDNYIAFNSAEFGGGGLRTREIPTIRNNTIVFNSSADAGPPILGGGGLLAAGDPVITNNVIAFSTDGAGLHVIVGDTPTADYNCVFGNFDGDYAGDAAAGPNDVNVDPELDDDDIHLLSSSPCIDAGDPDLDPLVDETDIDAESRIQNDQVDIGADETTQSDICEGDANGDGTVDPLDSGYVLARFGCPVGTGDPSCDAADQNGDGAVDPLDSGFVLARFGSCE